MPGQKIIAIAGNIGSGKSELAWFLCRRFGLDACLEPDEENPYLADFYRDTKTWAYRSRMFFLVRKFRLHLQRCIDKRDFSTYWELYRAMSATLRPPDLMIQLRCPVATLRQRIGRRGRSMEQDIPVNYPRRLNRLYDGWCGQCGPRGTSGAGRVFHLGIHLRPDVPATHGQVAPRR